MGWLKERPNSEAGGAFDYMIVAQIIPLLDALDELERLYDTALEQYFQMRKERDAVITDIKTIMIGEKCNACMNSYTEECNYCIEFSSFKYRGPCAENGGGGCECG